MQVMSLLDSGASGSRSKVDAPSAFCFLGPGTSAEGGEGRSEEARESSRGSERTRHRSGEEGTRRVYRDIPEDLRRVIEPIVLDHGCELLDVEMLGGARGSVLRVTIDRKEGDGRVEVERCAVISREIGTQLDVTDAMPGKYNLEVSSPGLDRMLSREKDFAAARGQEVKLKTRRPVGGRRRFKGRLIDFEDRVVHLNVDGQAFAIPFDEVEKANSMYQFSRADFAATGGKSGGNDR